MDSSVLTGGLLLCVCVLALYCPIHTYIHTYIHTHTHTYIRTYTQAGIHTGRLDGDCAGGAGGGAAGGGGGGGAFRTAWCLCDVLRTLARGCRRIVPVCARLVRGVRTHETSYLGQVAEIVHF